MECIHGLANNMCLRERISLLKQRGNSCRFQHFLFGFAGEEHKFPSPAIMRSRDTHCWALWIAENFEDSRWVFLGNGVDYQPFLRKCHALQRNVDLMTYEASSAITGQQKSTSHFLMRSLRGANSNHYSRCP